MTARLILMRHGEAAPVTDEDHDPGLTARGRLQAAAQAGRLTDLAPDRVVSSPLRRTRETAGKACPGHSISIDPRYAELPWPHSQTASQRHAAITTYLAAHWRDMEPDLLEWRERLIGAACAETGCVAIISHFVAINVLVGAALGEDRITLFRPDNASITILRVEGRRLHLEAMGLENEALFPDITRVAAV